MSWWIIGGIVVVIAIIATTVATWFLWKSTAWTIAVGVLLTLFLGGGYLSLYFLLRGSSAAATELEQNPQLAALAL